ncbi:hypothetical protein [Flavobacterium sp.]|uniref:hypothetical protein n=1 Tax=Flavobacterium sp. TaxID=239 RepID=UPI0025BB5EE8|nr:hypothetical protein [Flavobacterium sp.]
MSIDTYLEKTVKCPEGKKRYVVSFKYSFDDKIRKMDVDSYSKENIINYYKNHNAAGAKLILIEEKNDTTI